MNNYNEIEQFIKKFKFIYDKELEEVFMFGNCYYFAIILQERFNGDIYYLPIDNHFVCKINENYYDITGKVTLAEKPCKWKDFKNFDELLYDRIVKDCIKFVERK